MAKEKENPEEIKYNLLLALNEYGEIALHVAAEGSVMVLEKVWGRGRGAKEVQLNEGELKNELLLAKDRYEYSAWNPAAGRSSLESLGTLWSWAVDAEVTQMNFC